MYTRYIRQIDLPEIDIAGQEKIAHGRILIIGAGGLGVPAALYLAGAGVKTIGLADQDTVSLSNLHRQVIYREEDIRKNKIDVCARELRLLNTDININTYNTLINSDNIDDILPDYDIVLDCCDNFETRFTINEACFKHAKPLISASVHHFDGQIMTLRPSTENDLPCYQCLFPQMPEDGSIPKCSEAGVFGPTVGTIGCLQAGQALKTLLGLNPEDAQYILNINLLTLDFVKMQFFARPDCPVCQS